MNAISTINAGEGVNWRDQPIITNDRDYLIERAACCAEWERRHDLYADFSAWFLPFAHALEDIDNRREAGRERDRRAMWAAHDERMRRRAL